MQYDICRYFSRCHVYVKGLYRSFLSCYYLKCSVLSDKICNKSMVVSDKMPVLLKVILETDKNKFT